MKEEEWKDVVGYEGLYQVSNFGRVKSLEKMRGAFMQKEIIKKQIYSNGYLRCQLHKNGESRKIFIHRLVAEAFILNPDNKPQVDHIDRNRSNNSVENLRWCTAKENVLFEGTRDIRRRALNIVHNDPIIQEKRLKKVCKKVVQEDLNGKIMRIWNSLVEIKRELGVDVSNQCNKVYKRSYRIKDSTFRFFDPDRDGLLIAEYGRRKNL